MYGVISAVFNVMAFIQLFNFGLFPGDGTAGLKTLSKKNAFWSALHTQTKIQLLQTGLTPNSINSPLSTNQHSVIVTLQVT